MGILVRTIANKNLRRELLKMMKEDQKMRKSSAYDASVDKRNTARMKKIVRKYDWPTYDLVGKDGAFAAWLLVQHADYDLAFQKKCLHLLEEAVRQGQADKTNLAYLTDRVLVHEGKKQIYGTQFYSSESGKFGPRPIKDRPRLNKRRKSAGLEPFRQYERTMRKLQRKSSVTKGI